MADKVADPRWKKTNWNRRYQNQVEERMYLGKVDDRVRIARAYEKLGDYDNAFLYYNKALEKSPNDATTLMAIATLSEKAGNKAQAREYLARAYKADPATPGLVQAMTRNGLAISDVIAPPPAQAPIVPANDSK
jgi:tetratricopeptide (TPR) repeat protein